MLPNGLIGVGQTKRQRFNVPQQTDFLSILRLGLGEIASAVPEIAYSGDRDRHFRHRDR